MKIRWGFFLIIALGILNSPLVHAQELKIVDVRRNIPLSDDEPVYKDFYINGGESDGLKKNLVVTVVRRLQVHDSGGSQSFGEVLAAVGQLRIIQVNGRVAVAREYKLFSRDEHPMLEQVGILSGDKIDLTGAFVDNSKPNTKHSKAAATPHHDTLITAEVKMSPAQIPAAAAAAAAKAAETGATTEASSNNKAAPEATTTEANKSTPAPVENRPAALSGPTPASEPPSGQQKLEKTADSGADPVH